MRAFYGDRISPNQTKTPEGFLICHNVPIARTGTQDYLPREIGLKDGGGLVHVRRHAEDVFSPATLASFEGKPVTDDHPAQEVNPSNYGAYMKGVTQNVRQQGDYIVADLVVHDAQLIAEIEAGKREISCGYDCHYEKDGDGYKQTNIIGNHVAVVDRGRAGPKVSIKDEEPKGEKKMAKSKSILQRMFVSFVKDADPEEIQEAAKAVEEAQGEPEKKEAPEEETKDEETKVEGSVTYGHRPF